MARRPLIGIIGNGVVGGATARAFADHSQEVRAWDLTPKRSTHSLQEVLAADHIFICLPTPMYFDGSCDLSAIIQLFADLRSSERDLPFILRSTVPVGTTRMFINLYGVKNLIYSPEFLTMRTAANDAINPRAMFIGVNEQPENGGYRADDRYFTKLYDLYKEAFPDVDVITGDMSDVEAIKLFTNAFFTVKVTFFNELRAFANKIGLDWKFIVQGMLADGRINENHTMVPGPDGKFGFGGACLPKDMRSLLMQMWRAETPHKVLNAAAMENDEFRGKSAD